MMPSAKNRAATSTRKPAALKSKLSLPTTKILSKLLKTLAKKEL